MTVIRGAPVPVTVQRFVDAVVGRRPAEAEQIVRDTVSRVGPIGAIEQLLAPVQVHVGDRWLAGTVTDTDEHRVSAAVDEILDELGRSGDLAPVGPVLAVSTGVDDWHATAARMAEHRLRAAGWDARFVGVSLDADRLAEVQELGAIEAVALSCVTAPRLLGVARTIRLAHAAGLPVMVGGQAFVADPGRARRLGADAGPELPPPPAAGADSWLAVRAWDQPPTSVGTRLDAVLALDLGIVTQQVREALGDEPVAVDVGLAAALLRPAVDAWASAIAVDEPGIVSDQLAWTARYLAARGEPPEHVGVLAAGMRATVPIDPGDVLRMAVSPHR